MDGSRVHEALDEVLAQDVESLPDGEVHQLLMDFCRARCRVEGGLLDVADVWKRRRVWAGDGSKSASARLQSECGWSKHAARTAIGRAAKLRRMPAAAVALKQGRLTPEHVDVLDRAAEIELDAPYEDYEPVLVDAVAVTRFSDAVSMIDRWVHRHDPDTADERARKRFERRRASAVDTIFGDVHLSALLPKLGGAEFMAELDRLERTLYAEDRASGRARTLAQRRADALLVMARRSATLDLDEYQAGRSPRVLLTILAGEREAGHLLETLDGVVLTSGEVVPHLEWTFLERVTFDRDDQVIGISSQRSFTGGLRRAIQVRDAACTHPAGCDTPAHHCDVDHVIEYRHGGPTSQRNGRLRCQPHNRDDDVRDRTPGPGAFRYLRSRRGAIPDTGTRPKRRSTSSEADDESSA